jgi:hypothetical protein
MEDQSIAPIRTYEQVAAEMRRRGDMTMKKVSVRYYEQQAFKKLREALAEYAGDFE